MIFLEMVSTLKDSNRAAVLGLKRRELDAGVFLSLWIVINQEVLYRRKKYWMQIGHIKVQINERVKV